MPLPLNIEFAVGYLDGALQDEHPEIRKQWQRVREYLVPPAPARDRATIMQDLLAAERELVRARNSMNSSTYNGRARTDQARANVRRLEGELEALPLTAAPDRDGKSLEALELVEAAMLNGGDGAAGDFGWSIGKLNKARPAIRAALAIHRGQA